MKENKSNSDAPPGNATDSEIIDWYINRMRLGISPSSQQDIRGLSLSSDIIEFLSKFSSMAPPADELKNPFDYWAFVEPIFFPALRSSLIPEGGVLPYPPEVEEAKEDIAKEFPLYHWTWALDDCIETSLLSGEEMEEIRSKFPTAADSGQVNSDLQSSLVELEGVTKTCCESLLKLQKWIKQIEKSDFTKLRNSSLNALLLAAESLLKQLQRHQLLDSIEELHKLEEPEQVALVVDDIEKIKCIKVSISEAASLLFERDSTLDAPQAESVQFSYPFTARSNDDLLHKTSQIGPYCHICRQPKGNLVRCNSKIPSFYESLDSKDVKYSCPRRFCIDCLTAYNWPRPADSGKPENYKCPICLKLCTCDRCVRNVFLRVIKAFLNGLRSGTVPSANPNLGKPVESVYEFFSIIGDFSAFSLTQSTLESPTAAVLQEQPIVGRARRLSASKRFEDDHTHTRKRSRNAPSSVAKGIEDAASSIPASSDSPVEGSPDDPALSQGNDDTPDSARKKRRAAANIDSFYK